MSKAEARTPAVIREWRKSGDWLVLFPADPADECGRLCESLGWDGSSSANFNACIFRSRPAGPEATAKATAELRRRGIRFRLIRRTSGAIHEARRSEARRLRQR